MNRILSRICSRMGGWAAGLLLVSGSASGQSSEAPARYELAPPSWRSSAWSPYAGVSVGRPSYRLDCGVARCQQPSATGRVYAGAMWGGHWGAEMGYAQMGEADRAGGTVRAHALNFSLLGRAELGAGFGLFGRVGTTYGRTRASAGSGLTAGNASGWGPAYGLGLDWSFNEHWSAVLDWQRQRFDFAGDETGWVRATSIGLQYRF